MNVFGWATFTVTVQSQTLALADTEAGDITHAATVTMSLYRAFQLYHVSCYTSGLYKVCVSQLIIHCVNVYLLPLFFPVSILVCIAQFV